MRGLIRSRSFLAGVLLALAVGVMAASSGGFPSRPRFQSVGVNAAPPSTAGNLTAAGTITGALFSGSGASLTALNASNLSSGTVPDARFPATLPAASGANLTALNATNISTGTLADGRLSSNVPLKNAQNIWTATYQQFGSPATGYIRTDVANTFTFQPGTGGYLFRNSANGATPIMSMADAGNVAVSAPSSGYSMAIDTSGATSGALRITRSGAGGGVLNADASGLIASYDGLTTGGGLYLHSTGAQLYRGGNVALNVSSTGAVTVNAPSSGTTLTATGVANANAVVVTSPNTAGQSFGLAITAGTNTSDFGLLVQGAAGTNQFRVYGTGGVTIGTPTGTDKGAGTLNAAGTIYENNVAVCKENGDSCPAGATVKIAQARFNGDGTCAAGSGASGVTSCTRNSSGSYDVNITAAGFTAAPSCTVNSISTGTTSHANVRGLNDSVITTTALPVQTVSGGAVADQDFTIVCVGT